MIGKLPDCTGAMTTSRPIKICDFLTFHSALQAALLQCLILVLLCQMCVQLWWVDTVV
jgi:hypothetical protein